MVTKWKTVWRWDGILISFSWSFCGQTSFRNMTLYQTKSNIKKFWEPIFLHVLYISVMIQQTILSTSHTEIFHSGLLKRWVFRGSHLGWCRYRYHLNKSVFELGEFSVKACYNSWDLNFWTWFLISARNWEKMLFLAFCWDSVSIFLNTQFWSMSYYAPFLIKYPHSSFTRKERHMA